MQNNVNTFNAAKMSGATDRMFERQYNNLIDILQRQIKILQADIANGITVDNTGKVLLGLASATTSGAISSADWSTFNNKQDQSNELDALSILADTAGFLKKTGDAAYSIDTNTYLQSGSIDDTVYGAGWDNDTTHAPTKNAVYDKIQTIVGGGASVTISATAPATPTAGDLWWSTEEGTLKIYYDDGDSVQWVDASTFSSGVSESMAIVYAIALG